MPCAGLVVTLEVPKFDAARYTELRLEFAVEVLGMIAPNHPKVSTTPWSNSFVFSLVPSVPLPQSKYMLAKQWREQRANTPPNVTGESHVDQLVANGRCSKWAFH